MIGSFGNLCILGISPSLVTSLYFDLLLVEHPETEHTGAIAGRLSCETKK